MKQRSSAMEQLGFTGLLAQAEADNQAHRFERETGHLPSSYEEAIPFYRDLIDKHHFAMVMARAEETMRLREEAHRLARRLIGGNAGILAGDNAPGNVLARETAAAQDDLPLWGQQGSFVIDVDGMRVRIALQGMIGIASTSCYWPGFSAHAVEYDRPFLSETGFRSFLGIHAEPVFALLPDAFAVQVIKSYVKRQLKGRLVALDERYRPEGQRS